MRILHVTDTFLPKIGGAEIAIDQLTRAMNAQGAQAAVLAQQSRAAGGEVNVPYPLRRFRNPQSSRWAGWWIQRQIQRTEKHLADFDVYIGHHAFPPGFAVVKHARRTGRPSVVYPRGGDIYEVSRFRKKAAAWKKLAWALANASAVICASQAMEDLVRQIIGISAAEGRLVRIPNGVNIHDLQQDASASRFAGDPQFNAPFILGLGRTIRRKGFHILIDAFNRCSRKDCKLVIAGDGRDLEALKAQASSLSDRVHFTGLVDGADKRWLLQNCLFMAAPSLEESFGNVALEAMACGKPVVASRASGFAEIIKDNENGCLVEVGSSTALAQALSDYIARDLKAQSTAARNTAQSFSWESIAKSYLDLITRLKSEA